MFAVWPTFTVTGCAASASSRVGSIVGGSAGADGREDSPSKDRGGVEGVEEGHVGVAGVVEVCLQWDLTCDEY